MCLCVCFVRQAKRGNNLPDLSWELGLADEPEGELDE